MGSLQDALLKTGLADERRKPDTKSKGAEPASGRRGQGSPDRNRNRNSAKRKVNSKSQASDLERAWRARRKAEKDEAERVKQARVADQEARRKRNLELDAVVVGKSLNSDEGELPRYFEHLGRIRRVLCTPRQREAINAGELGIVNLRGRYLIVEPDVLAKYKALAPDLVPDLTGTEPDARESDEPDYPPVPDDITW